MTLRVARVYDLHYKYHVGCALRIFVAQLLASHIQEVPLKGLCSGAVCTYLDAYERQQGREIFLFPRTFRPTVGPTQSATRWLPGGGY